VFSNKGLGFETARRLLSEGHDVWVAARNVEAGTTAATNLEARFVQLGVNDDASVAAAVETVGSLDVLINNAGISGARKDVGDVTADDLREVYETNVLGPVRVLPAFLRLLLGSDNGVVVNVASGLGSQAETHDPDRVESTVLAPAYCSSKSALVMLTRSTRPPCQRCASTRSTPVIPPPTSTGTPAPRPSPRAPTPSSPWPRSTGTAQRVHSSTATASSLGKRRPQRSARPPDTSDGRRPPPASAQRLWAVSSRLTVGQMPLPHDSRAMESPSQSGDGLACEHLPGG